MIEITKVIEWDMGHRVPNHKNKCRSPHGHRYRLELTVRGDLNREEGQSSQGMVYDFGDLKHLMMVHIHDVLDHGFMLYENDSWMKKVFCEQVPQDEGIRIIVVPFVPTAENIALWCLQKMQAYLPSYLTISRCRVFETPNSWADCC